MSSKNVRPIISVTAMWFVVISFILPGCGEILSDAEYLARAKEYQEKGQAESSIIELKNALNANPDNIEARWLLGEVYLDVGLGPAAEKELRRAMELGLSPAAVTVSLGRALLVQDKYQDVLGLSLEQAGLSNDDLALLTAIHGHAHYGLGDNERARDSYKQALSVSANVAEAMFGMARVSMRDGSNAVAGEWIDKALAADPKLASAWSLAGDLELSRGATEKAEIAFGKAIAYPPWSATDLFKRALVRIYLGKFDEASVDIDAIRRRMRVSPAADYAQGLIYFSQGNYKEATAILERAINASSEFLPPVLLLGITNFMQGNDEQAYSYLAKYVNKDKQHIQAQQLLSILDMRAKNFETAKQRLAPIMMRVPDDLLTLKLMANLSMVQGDTSGALEYLQKVTTIEPKSPLNHAIIGLGFLMGGDFAESTSQFQQSIDLGADFQYAEVGLVMSYFSQGDQGQALLAAQNFAERYPDSPVSLNLLGLVYLTQKDVEKAEKVFKKVLESFPGDVGANQNLAVLSLRRGNLKEAIKYYDTILKHNPGQMKTVVRRANVLQQMGQTEEAQKFLESIVKSYPLALEPRVILADIYTRNGKADLAVSLMLDVKNQYESHPAYYAALGDAQLEMGAITEAIFSYERLAALQPKIVLSHYNLARAYYTAGNMGEFEQAINNALLTDPTHFPSKVAKLGYLIKQKKLDEAASLLNELKKTHPLSIELLRSEADIALLQERPEDAVSGYKKLMELKPSSDVLGSLVTAYILSGDKNESIKVMESWLLNHPDDLGVRYSLANMYVQTDRSDDAFDAYSFLVEKNPNHVMAIARLALLVRHTDSERALDYAKKAYELAPDSAPVQALLASIMLDRADNKPALKLLEKAVENDPENLHIQYQFARALARNGDGEKAIKVINDILRDGRPFVGEQEARDLLEELSNDAG